MDESGKRIRTNADHGPVKDYDSYVFDVYSKYVPQPVDISTCSVYDKYDILEEIGEYARTGHVRYARYERHARTRGLRTARTRRALIDAYTLN